MSLFNKCLSCGIESKYIVPNSCEDYSCEDCGFTFYKEKTGVYQSSYWKFIDGRYDIGWFTESNKTQIISIANNHRILEYEFKCLLPFNIDITRIQKLLLLK
jgi:hypothetical protein